MNKAIIIGYLGRDPELRHTQVGNMVCNFSVATTERWSKDGEKKEKTEWHNVVVWGKLADIAPTGKKDRCYHNANSQNRYR